MRRFARVIAPTTCDYDLSHDANKARRLGEHLLDGFADGWQIEPFFETGIVWLAGAGPGYAFFIIAALLVEALQALRQKGLEIGCSLWLLTYQLSSSNVSQTLSAVREVLHRLSRVLRSEYGNLPRGG